LRKRLKHHLRQHPLHRAHDSLILEQLVRNVVVGLLALNDDVGRDVLEVAHGELLLVVALGLGSQRFVFQQLALDGGD
jgi:nucleoside permease NupC